MAGPKDPQNSNPLPQRVMPQNPTRPIDPDDVYDMVLGPGDSTVQAAYFRTTRNTTAAGQGIRAVPQEEIGADALLLRKIAKRSRSLTFTVQGIMWRAGFAPDIAQTPLGQASPFRRILDAATVNPSGAILRPVEAPYELVFRELIPQVLLTQCDQTYGLIRKLDRVALYYFPAGQGATAGVLAQYAEQATSRPHVLYLQTNIKNASPTVLEQIQKTFLAAIPRAIEAQKEVGTGDFWQEVDRSLYQVTATFKNSVLGGGTRAATTSLQRSAQQAGARVEKAASVFEVTWRAFDVVLAMPSRIGVAMLRGFTRMTVSVIEALDRNLKSK